MDDEIVFQSLIGELKTDPHKICYRRYNLVSIPHRRAKNSILHLLPPFVFLVSIPHRRAKNFSTSLFPFIYFI